MQDVHPNLAHARRYLAALERGAVDEELAAFFTPDVCQIERPNRLVPGGRTRALEALLADAKAGQSVMRSQRFEILSETCDGDRVALEVRWSGELGIPIGSLPAGGAMTAWFAVFLDYADGRIAHQRNYDCFEPF